MRLNRGSDLVKPLLRLLASTNLILIEWLSQLYVTSKQRNTRAQLYKILSKGISIANYISWKYFN